MTDINPNTVLLAVAIWPGLTMHQLAGRLGLREYGGGRSQPYTYPVKKALAQLAREGYVRSQDEPGGRGAKGWRRTWHATPGTR